MRRPLLTLVFLGLASFAAFAQVTGPPLSTLARARQALAARQFTLSRQLFTSYLAQHPKDLDAQLGIADSELGLHLYEAAELDYRRVTAQQPQQWFAHRNLVIVEAALHRWEEFDRERQILRDARARHAPGLTPQDSAVIDTLDLGTGAAARHWIVRDYATPLGRTGTLYNFERFSAAGRVEAYVSLESATALATELAPQVGVKVGNATSPPAAFALNYYDGHSHTTLATYPTEPTYERIRADFLHWAVTHSKPR